MLRHLIVLALALALAVEARPDHHHDEAEGNGHNHDHNHEDGPGHHHHHHHEHNHEKWEKYGQEWRDMRSEILEIRDGVSHIKEDLHKMEAGLDSAPSYEEAVQITGAEEKPGGKHMKIEYRSEEMVRMVKPDGSLEDELLPRGSSILGIFKNQKDKREWNKIDQCDMMAYWHYGSPVRIHVYTATGEMKQILLTNPLTNNELPGATFADLVLEGDMFSFEVVDEDEDAYSVLSLSCSPGWTQERHLKLPAELKDGNWYLPTAAMKAEQGLQ